MLIILLMVMMINKNYFDMSMCVFYYCAKLTWFYTK